MSNDACNCCEVPPCAIPTLECISVTATCSNSPCGEVDPNAPPPDPTADPPVNAKYCKTITTDHGGTGNSTRLYSLDEDDNCTATCSGSWGSNIVRRGWDSNVAGYCDTTQTPTVPHPTVIGSCSSYTYNEKLTYNADCTLNIVPFNGSGITTKWDVWRAPAPCEDGSKLYTSTYVCTNGEWTHTYYWGADTPTVDQGGVLGELCDLCEDASVLPTPPDTTTYEDCTEVPPCDLEFPDFPSWPTQPPDPPVVFEDGQDDSCTAIRNWDAGWAMKTETKVKWRIKHSPTGTCYLKVWLRKTTSVGGDPDAIPPIEPTVTTDDSETYEWTGTGNPCIANPNDGAASPSNDIVGDENTLDPPSENGSITVEILKFSCVPGYEPDVSDEENPQPNGYPDPAWEAAAP